MAECPECGKKVKAAPGKLTICPKCATKFRAPADDDREPAQAKKTVKAAAKSESSKPAAPPPADVGSDMYGFSPDEVDLGEVRRARDEEDKKKAAEKAKKGKPNIEIQ